MALASIFYTAAKKLLLSFALILIALLAGSYSVGADVNDFVINDMSVRYELSNDVPGGSMRVKESIDLTFRHNNQGILRATPEKYGANNLNLTVIDVRRNNEAEQYTTLHRARKYRVAHWYCWNIHHRKSAV
jgi:hypothetical protein